MNNINRFVFLGVCLLLAVIAWPANAQVPQIINYQGRVVVGTTNFDGTGQFRFALVNAAGTTTYWSNDGTSVNGSQPTNAVSLAVSKGLYAVLLGDTTVTNMTLVPASVFNNSDVRLRVWFNDGTTGSQLLTPDQRLASVGYAMTAGTVSDGAITSAKIANGAVGSSQIGTGAVGGAQLANFAVAANQIATGSITADKFATNNVVKSINGLTDILTLAAGSNISITPSGNTLTLSATGGGSSIWQLNGLGYPYYDGAGFVGIGTNNPNAFKLSIASTSNGSILRMDGIAPYMTFVDTSVSNAVTTIGAPGGGLYINNNQTGSLLQLTPTGFLGLGTTTPVSRLQIKGTADALRLTALHPYLTLDDTAAAGPSRIEANVGGMDLKSNGAVSGSNPGGLIHLDTIGTVGIGTRTPLHQLSIRYFPGAPTWTSNGWTGALDLDNSSAIAWGTNSAGQRFGMGHTNGSFSMWRTAADPGTTASPAVYDFSISDSGNVGIGTTAPQFPLDVNGTMHVGSYLANGTPKLIRFGDINGISSYVSIGENNVDDQMELTAGRFVFINGSVGIGTATPTAKLDVNGAVAVNNLTIRGGADLAEPFQVGEEEVEQGSVVVIDDRNPGRLKCSRNAYDKRVAGIVSGANGVHPGIALHQEGLLDQGQNVALSGRVYVRAEASSGPIRPGDLLTTSDLPGRAMRATDPAQAQGAILGKAMSELPEGEGLVLVLVTLQ
ncbi:MAG: hypothetical protein ABI992_02435 [Chthoniobacterales bacterium]